MTLVHIFQQLQLLDRTTVTLSSARVLEETLQYCPLIPAEYMLGRCMHLLLTQYAYEFASVQQADIAECFSRMALMYATDPDLQIPKILVDISALTAEGITKETAQALHIKLQYVFYNPLDGDGCEAVRIKLCELARDAYANNKFDAAYHLFRIASNFLQPILENQILFIQNSLNTMLSAVNSGTTYPMVLVDFQQALDNYVYSEDIHHAERRNMIGNTLLDYGRHYYGLRQYGHALQFLLFSLPMHSREKENHYILIETLKNIVRCAVHVNADEASKAIVKLYDAIKKYKFEASLELSRRILLELDECRTLFENKKLKAQEIMLLKVMVMVAPKNKFFDKNKFEFERTNLIRRERKLLMETLNEIVSSTPFETPKHTSLSPAC